MIQLFAEEDPFFRDISNTAIQIIPPVSYLQMVLLESLCGLIITDSGGVQKEAFFYNKPCIVLRPETEWVELVESGAAILVDADKSKLLSAVKHFENSPFDVKESFYGDGNSAELICKTLIQFLSNKRA